MRCSYSGRNAKCTLYKIGRRREKTKGDKIKASPTLCFAGPMADFGYLLEGLEPDDGDGDAPNGAAMVPLGAQTSEGGRERVKRKKEGGRRKRERERDCVCV